MSEADRSAAAKAERARTASATNSADAANAERQRRARVVAEAQASIPVVTAKLEAAGYPGVQQVQVWEERRFGKPKPTMKGGWVLCQVQSLHYGEMSSFPVYLLSDGRLYHYGCAKGPEDVIVTDHDKTRNQDTHVRDLDQIADALRRLATGETQLPSD